MCSVTFCPRRGGYIVGMNRDENLARVRGLPPARADFGDVCVLHPREPAGGTWISVNDRGVVFALVNWYAVTARAPRPVVSRGEVVSAMRDALTSSESGIRFGRLDLPRMDPFRLVGLFPEERLAVEWRWDVRHPTRTTHAWTPMQWLSSGHDEPAAQQVRGGTFESVRDEPDAGSVPWLRRLHASHAPERGPFSTCMHRTDAATVSYTEIEVDAGSVRMDHSNEALCCGAVVSTKTLRRIL